MTPLDVVALGVTLALLAYLLVALLRADRMR